MANVDNTFPIGFIIVENQTPRTAFAQLVLPPNSGTVSHEVRTRDAHGSAVAKGLVLPKKSILTIDNSGERNWALSK
jgi:hypothetical protein